MIAVRHCTIQQKMLTDEFLSCNFIIMNKTRSVSRITGIIFFLSFPWITRYVKI